MTLNTAKRYNSSQANLLNFKTNADTAAPNKMKLYHFPSSIVFSFQYCLGNLINKEKRLPPVAYPIYIIRFKAGSEGAY